MEQLLGQVRAVRRAGTGLPSALRDQARAMVELREADALQAELLEVLIEAAFQMGDHDEARVLLARLRHTSRAAGGDAALASLAMASATAAFFTGRPEDALIELGTAARLYRRLGNKERLTTVEARLGGVAVRRARWADAIGHLTAAHEAASEAGIVRIMAASLSNRAIAYTAIGDLPAATRDAKAAMVLERSVGNVRGMVFCHERLGRIATISGDPAEAAANYLEAVSLCGQIGNHASLIFLHANLAFLYRDLGFTDEAWRHARRVVEVETEVDPHGRAWGHVVIGLLHLEAGDLEQAQTHGERALELLGDQPSDAHANTYELMTRVALARNDIDAARRAAEALRYTRTDLRQRITGVTLEAQVAAAAGEIDEGLTLLDEALELAEGSGFIWHVEAILTTRAELRASRSDFEGAYRELALLAAGERARRQHQNARHMEMLRAAFQAEVERERAAEDRLRSRALDEANARLQRVARERDEALGVLAHDLRSPIMAVDLGAQQVLEDLRAGIDPAEVIEDVDRIGQAARQMAEQVREALERVRDRGDSLDAPALPEVVDVASLIEDVVRVHRLGAVRKGIALDIEREGYPAVSVEVSLLRDIVDNLVTNAVKFSERGTTVRVRVGWGRVGEGTGVVIDVLDQGPGFSEQDRDGLFRRFARLSARPTGDEMSTGLGLYIVKRRCAEIGATIDLISPPGEGAHFRVKLPLMAVAGADDGEVTS